MKKVTLFLALVVCSSITMTSDNVTENLADQQNTSSENVVENVVKPAHKCSIAAACSSAINTLQGYVTIVDQALLSADTIVNDKIVNPVVAKTAPYCDSLKNGLTKVYTVTHDGVTLIVNRPVTSTIAALAAAVVYYTVTAENKKSESKE